ncbi:transcription factor ORG2-like [Gastrolobium bilobum]|uniref:transcription factor ORG2-like n=1 Tax=Gastrolobium bilobum TaxID=150636 RepID=UPI002AB0526E|nr:transcription factor ORG2-like [Gastrolobium bilobum]
MLALSPPPMFSPIEWPFEEPKSNSQNYLYKDTEAYEQFYHQLFSSQTLVGVKRSTDHSSPICSDPTMVKKLDHNASERDRRKKINALYSSLRSLIPVADQMRKLSIPATISRVLNYIPDLQQQVEGLARKKEEISLKISQQGNAVISEESKRKIAHYNSDFVVSVSRLNDSEASIEISSYKVHKIPLSEMLLCLENDGLVMLNASSSETFGGRIFYNLHFQVDNTHGLESEILSEKLLSIFEKKEGNFPVK